MRVESASTHSHTRLHTSSLSVHEKYRTIFLLHLSNINNSRNWDLKTEHAYLSLLCNVLKGFMRITLSILYKDPLLDLTRPTIKIVRLHLEWHYSNFNSNCVLCGSIFY